MAILAWVNSKKVFLKIQKGTGSNLSREDIAKGFTSYFLWSTFEPGELDIDETLDMDLSDSGMLLCRDDLSVDSVLQGCYEQATGESFNVADVFLLLETKED